MIITCAMRLRAIQWILGAALSGLDYRTHGRRGADGKVYVTVKEVPTLRSALNLVAQIDQFRTEVDEIAKSPVFGPHYESVEVLEEDSNNVRALIHGLKDEMRLLKETVDQILPAERLDSFAIHIPLRDLMSLKDFLRELAELEEVFEQPLRRLTETELSLSGVDSGSVVIEFVATALDADATKALAGLKLVTILYEKSKDFLLFRQSLDRQREENRALGLANDMLELDLKLKEALVETKLQQLKVDMVKDFPEAAEENFRHVLGKSIRKLAEKLEHGMKLTLASNTPKSIAAIANEDLLAPKGVLEPSADPVPREMAKLKGET